jgi:hypothetical protein
MWAAAQRSSRSLIVFWFSPFVTQEQPKASAIQGLKLEPPDFKSGVLKVRRLF